MRERRYGGDVRFRSPSPPPYSPPLRVRTWDREHSSRRHGIEEERYPREYERARRAEDGSGSMDMRVSGEYNRRCYDEDRSNRDELRVSQFSEGLFHGHPSKYNWRLDCGDRDRDRDGEKGGHLGRLHQYDEVFLRKDSGNYNWRADGRDRDEYRDRTGQFRRLSRYNGNASHGDSTSVKFQWNHLSSKPTKLSSDAGYSSKHFTDDYGVTASQVSTERGYYDGSANRSRSMLDKPISVESHQGKIYPSYPPDDGISRIAGHVNVSSSSHVDGDFSLSSGNLHTSLFRDEGIQFGDCTQLDKLSADKPLVRELYEEEENQFLYRKDASDHIVSSSQSKDYVPKSSSVLKELSPILRESLCGSSDGSRTGMRPVDRTVYGQRLHMKSPPYTEMQLSDMRSYSRPYCSPRGGKCGDYAYCEIRRSERADLGTTSDEFYGRMGRFQEGYKHHNLLKTSADRISDRIDEGSHWELVGEGNLWDHYPSSKGQTSSSFLDGSESLLPGKPDGQVLGHRNGQLEYERKEYQDQVNVHLGEVHGHEKEGGSWPDKKLEMLPISEYDSCMDGIDGFSQQRLTVGKLCLHESSSKISKRKHSLDKKLRKCNNGSRVLNKVKTTHKVHFKGEGGEWWTSEDMEPLFLSKKSRFGQLRHGKRGRTSIETSSQGISDSVPGSLSMSKPRHLSEPRKSDSRDIKKRLGPGPQHTRVSYPSANKSKSLLKKRLGPASQTAHATLPWLKVQKSYKWNRIPDCSEGSLIDEGEDVVQGNTTSKTEPPENSEDFKQLVHAAFFKFVKKLNENPALRRRLLEQGKAGGLKCSICGSDSEVFVGAESLAVHAFTSQKVGFRSQHLGFHKALCVLMGWESSVAPNGTWVRRTLSDDETKSLKEDLIVWPPVVIIHNRSLLSSNPAERVIVSIEKLEAILRDMGFGDKTKVRRGEPANQSVMVVRFNSTFSGLQEAEWLSKFYAELKHGRADLQQINSSDSNGSSGDTQKSSPNEVNCVLYGYLAIAGDLDKLDYETKKRCLVKSKKELQDIAYASVKEE